MLGQQLTKFVAWLIFCNCSGPLTWPLDRLAPNQFQEMTIRFCIATTLFCRSNVSLNTLLLTFALSDNQIENTIQIQIIKILIQKKVEFQMFNKQMN